MDFDSVGTEGKRLLETVVAILTDSPEDAQVRVTKGNSTVMFSLDVAKNDVGKVIGRQGRNADAISTLLNAMGAKHGIRVILDINKPNEHDEVK
jgi:predicted RNA-binding protein YlqC (UPF0109 family)